MYHKFEKKHTFIHNNITHFSFYFQQIHSVNRQTKNARTTTTAAARAACSRTRARTNAVARAPSDRSACSCTTVRTGWNVGRRGSAVLHIGRRVRRHNTAATQTISVFASKAQPTGSVCIAPSIPEIGPDSGRLGVSGMCRYI